MPPPLRPPERRVLERVIDEQWHWVEHVFRRDQYLTSAVRGWDHHGNVALTVLTDPGVMTPTDKGDILFVPGPLGEDLPTLTACFVERAVTAASLLGEMWAFPDDDPDAVDEFLAGRGGPPSAHPRRTEGVIVATFCPLLGYSRMQSRRIVRASTGAYLQRWNGRTGELFNDTVEAGAPAAVSVAGWLELCLPAPDDRARAAARMH